MMTTRVANPPLGRLQWVLKTFAKRPRVAWGTFSVAATTLGMVGPGRTGLEKWLEHNADVLKRPTSYDFIFPWIAAQLSDTEKKIEKGALSDEALQALVDLLQKYATTIALWAGHEKVELAKMSLTDIIAAAEAWKPPVKVDQGEVVYKFKDGWTVQRLTSQEQLVQEGEAMQNCVGGGNYRVGTIYSLRDKKGQPHVTIEVTASGKVKEALGKQNAPPIPEYQKRVYEGMASIERRLREQLRALLVPGADLADADLADANLIGADLVGANLGGATLTRATLIGADLTRATLRGATLRGADLTRAHLTDADLVGADLTRAHLIGAHLIGADLTRAHLIGADLIGADLRGANLTDADLDHADLVGADLVGAKWPSDVAPPAGWVLDEHEKLLSSL